MTQPDTSYSYHHAGMMLLMIAAIMAYLIVWAYIAEKDENKIFLSIILLAPFVLGGVWCLW